PATIAAGSDPPLAGKALRPADSRFLFRTRGRSGQAFRVGIPMVAMSAVVAAEGTLAAKAQHDALEQSAAAAAMDIGSAALRALPKGHAAQGREEPMPRQR